MFKSPTLGRWWEPNNPNNIRAGVLIERLERGWYLQLEGLFDEIPIGSGPIPSPDGPRDHYPVLCGQTVDGDDLTLFDCPILRRPMMPPPFATGVVELWPRILALDVHFDSEAEFCLSSLSVRYSNLDEWVGESGFEVNFTSGGTTFSHALPEVVTVALPDGVSLEVDFSSSGPSLQTPQTDFRIVQRSWLTVKVSEKLHYDELLRRMTTFADFVSLGVGQSIRSIESRATHLASSGTTEAFAIIYNRPSTTTERSDLHPIDMLFTFVGIRERFAELITRWFSVTDHIAPLKTLYFGTLRNPSTYVEHRFINMFQALESYDRRLNPQGAEKIAAHQERLKKVLEVVPQEDRTWLKEQARRPHEKGAAERLKDLVVMLDAAWIFKDYVADIDLATRLRNFYTHYDQSKAASLPPTAEHPIRLHNFSVQLQTLVEVAMLVVLGISPQEARERLQKARRLERLAPMPAVNA